MDDGGQVLLSCDGGETRLLYDALGWGGGGWGWGVFFFKQKTAYEMCGRDWSSDVCSSDLHQDPASIRIPLPSGPPPIRTAPRYDLIT